MTPRGALDQLREGNARFVSNATKKRDWLAQVVSTASGQSPFAAVLGCMDSRAPVEVLFDQGLGDVLTVRVAGNVVNDDVLGSLEYAVQVGVKVIVVLGHTGCGAVQGAIHDVWLDHLTGVLDRIRPAVKAVRRDGEDPTDPTRVARENVLHSLQEIRTKSRYIARHLDEGKVGLAGAMYDIATGRVTFLGD
jgi:carbonic anhydrase